MMMAAFNYLLVLFVVPSFATKDTILGNETITGNVGEMIGLKCFEQPANPFQPGRISWKYLYGDVYVQVAECVVTPTIGKWENLLYGHQLMGNDEECDDGIAYINATDPGEFSYKCEEMDEDDRHVLTEMYFLISIEFNSSLCLVKHVPTNGNLTFDFICTNFNLQGFPTEVENNTRLILRNNYTRFTPNITLDDRIIIRIELENVDSITEYYCINQNVSSACVTDNTTLSNPIGIIPLVNQVTEGDDATFECIFRERMAEEYDWHDWRVSRHINSSRTPNTTSSIFKILDVELKDEGVTVICSANVNGTLFYSEAFLEVIPRRNHSNASNCPESSSCERKHNTLQPTSGNFTMSPTVSKDDSFNWRLLVMSVFIILVVCTFFIFLFNSRTNRLFQRCPNREPNVHAGTGITVRNDSQVCLHPKPVSPSTTRRQSDHLLTATSGESVVMLAESGSSLQNVDHLKVKDATMSTKHPRQSSSSSHSVGSRESKDHVFHELERGKYSPPIPTSAAQSILQIPIALSTFQMKPCNSKTVLDNYILPTDEKQKKASLTVKRAYEQSSKGTQSIPLTRKGSATNQPLPPIPNSSGSQDIDKLSSSSKLPEAVTKQMNHGYATIGDEGQRQNKSSTPDSGIDSPSTLTVNFDFSKGKGESDEQPGKLFPNAENKTSNQNSVFTPECNTYSVPYADKVDMSTKSIYHTIDQDSNSKELSTEGQFHRGDNASSRPKTSSRHIYEMPRDDIATNVNCQAISAETSFYFSLEPDDFVKLQDKVVQKPNADDPAT